MPAPAMIADLPADTTPASGDLVATVDVSDTTDSAAGSSKKVTAANLTKALSVVVGDSGSGGTKGLVPAPAAGDAAAGKFLKADGTYAVPPGTGSGAEVGANSDITSMDGLTGALENPTKIVFPEAAAPSTPGANKVVLYAKSDGLLYSKDDAGTETVVTGGGGGGGTPGGSDTQVQFNDSSAFGGDAGFTFNKTTNVITVTGAVTSPEMLSGSSAQSDFRIAKSGLGTPGMFVGTDLSIGFADAALSHVGRHGGFLKITSNGSGGQGTFVHVPNTRAQFTANQNNLDIPENYWLRWNSDASRDITGMRNETSDPFSGRQANGETHLITNVGSQDIVLKHESTSSTDVNRFLNSTGADITLSANQAADVIYDGTTQRWRVYKKN